MYSKVIYMWQNCLATKLKSLCRTNLHAGDKSISQSVNKEEAWDSTDLLGSVCAPEDFYTTFFKAFFSFLDAIASPSTYCQWVGQSVIHSFRFGAIATNTQYLYKIPIPILISTDLLGSVCAPEGRLTRTESWSDRRVPWTLRWEFLNIEVGISEYWGGNVFISFLRRIQSVRPSTLASECDAVLPPSVMVFLETWMKPKRNMCWREMSKMWHEVTGEERQHRQKAGKLRFCKTAQINYFSLICSIIEPQ